MTAWTRCFTAQFKILMTFIQVRRVNAQTSRLVFFPPKFGCIAFDRFTQAMRTLYCRSTQTLIKFSLCEEVRSLTRALVLRVKVSRQAWVKGPWNEMSNGFFFRRGSSMLMNSFYRTFLCFDTVARFSFETKTFSFVCFRAASSIGWFARHVVPNCATHSGLSFKALSLHFGKRSFYCLTCSQDTSRVLTTCCVCVRENLDHEDNV